MNPEDLRIPVSLGTTNFMIKYDGGVILASDSRTTRGTFIDNRNSRKAINISPSDDLFGSIWLARSGNSAHSQVLVRYLYNYLTYHAMELGPNDRIELETVAHCLQSMTYSNKDYISAGFLLTNGSKIMSVLDSGAVFTHDNFASKGSGSIYIEGYLKHSLKPGMSVAAAKSVATKAMALAIDGDSASGGNLILIDIKENGSYTEEVILNTYLRDLIKNQQSF